MPTYKKNIIQDIITNICLLILIIIPLVSGNHNLIYIPIVTLTIYLFIDIATYFGILP